MSTSTTNIDLPELPGGAATVLRWLVTSGAKVAAGAPLVIVRTNQVEVALPMPTAGHVAELAKVGATLEPGAVLAQINGAAHTSPEQHLAEPAPPPAAQRATPTARQIALLNNIDLNILTGSGADGRVVKADVLAAKTKDEQRKTKDERPGDRGTGRQGDRATEEQRNRGTKEQRNKGTEEQGDVAGAEYGLTHGSPPSAPLLGAATEAQPIATAMVDVDVSEALALVAAQKAAFARVGLEASLTAVVAQAMAELLPHYPLFNAAYSASGIIRRRSVHLAVGSLGCDGLHWAYVTHAGDLTLRGMARALRSAPPTGDCTFALLSLPVANGYSAMPPLPGTGALLAIGAPTQRAVVLPGDRIAVRPLATLTLSYDARLLNYAEVGCFLTALRRAVER